MSEAVLITPLSSPENSPHSAVLRITEEGAEFITYNNEEDNEPTRIGYMFNIENMVIGLMGFLSNGLQPVPLTIPSTDGVTTFVFDVHYAVVQDISEQPIALILMRIDGEEYLLNEKMLLSTEDLSVYHEITNMIWQYVNSISRHMGRRSLEQ